MKKLTTIFLVFIILCSTMFAGCYFHIQPYYGNDPELYTIAVNSMPVCGHGTHEVGFSSEIKQLEKDSYGRVLFAYRESSYICPYLCVLVSQYVEEDRAYYYQDYNFFRVIDADLKEFDRLGKDYLYQTLELGETIDFLKEINDWNKPINKEKCVSSKIVRYSDYVAVNDKINLDVKQLGIEKEKYYLDRYNIDNYGNQLISVTVYYNTTLGAAMENGVKYAIFFIIASPTGKILNKDYCFISVIQSEGDADYSIDIHDHIFAWAEKLKILREQNYWNVRSIDDIINEMGSL